MRRRHPSKLIGADMMHGLLLPSELAIYRAEEWSSSRDHHHARSAWFRSHGIDPADWNAVYPVLVASKRAHARTPNELPAIDRARQRLTVHDRDEETT